MKDNILFVDDEPNILNAFRRQLHNQYEVHTATSGQEALSLLSTTLSFSVIVSDLRMPGMDGIQFLASSREICPDTVRILLTGHADLTAAIEAVNEGFIFRFLTKPCEHEILIKALQAGLEYYRLLNVEHELLEKTLNSSVSLFTEILSLTNPMAFGSTMRIKNIVNRMLGNLKPPNTWQYELAAMLCQIGSIVLPQSLLEKSAKGEFLTKREDRLMASNPWIGFSLISKIPRLEQIALMVKKQNQNYATFSRAEDTKYQKEQDEINLGAQILKVAIDYDKLAQSGMAHKDIVHFMVEQERNYNPQIIQTLGNEPINTNGWMPMLVDSESIEVGMIIQQDLFSKEEQLILPKGHTVNIVALERIQYAAQMTGIIEPFMVLAKVGKHNLEVQ